MQDKKIWENSLSELNKKLDGKTKVVDQLDKTNNKNIQQRGIMYEFIIKTVKGCHKKIYQEKIDYCDLK